MCNILPVDLNMMQNTRLTSTTGVTTVKKEVGEALNHLEASPCDTQSAYTNLTRIFNALADHPKTQLVVDMSLAAQTNVELLKQLVRMHLRHEEVQWVLGKVIAIACQASVRFQCQAGQLEMWSELFDMRSTHPHSIRVQEASLRASEALFRNNEFHITKLSSQQLLDELLGVMDRFLCILTPRRRAHNLVVLALRVLVVLYSSPRPTCFMLFNGKGPAEGDKWVDEISRRMLESFTLFNRKNDTIRLWLNMVLLLLRRHPDTATNQLFSPTTNKETIWWFVAVVERWQNEAEVMNSLLATLTYIFALPHNTLGDAIQVSLAEKLIVKQKLLDLVCEVIDRYHQIVVYDTNSTPAMVLFEAIRVVRQWSERSKILPRLEASPSVKSTLIPVLVAQLYLQSKSSILPPKSLVMVLEVLLILRHLAANFSLRRTLVDSESLQTSLKWLRCGTANAGNEPFNDSDLNALVGREARNLQKLVGPNLDATPKGNPQTLIVASKSSMTRQSRPLRADLVKAKTRQVYCSKR